MKRILAIIAAVLVGYSSYSATVAVQVAGGAVSNIVSGASQVTDIVLASAANNVATVAFVNAPSAVMTNVVPANVTTGVYATNYITSYTNYFGVQNNFTNVALVQYSITNAATTNYYSTVLALNAGTNSTVSLLDVSYVFNRGITITNGGAAAATLSVTYVQ